MSALPQPSSHYVYNPDDWIAVGEAARLLGANAGHLRRRCKDELVQNNDATLRPMGGGRVGWFVRRSIDKRLELRVDQIDAGKLAGYTESQRLLAFARMECVKAYQKRAAEEARPECRWLDALVAELRESVVRRLRSEYGLRLKVSGPTLKRWARQARGIDGVANLIDGRGGDYSSQGDADAWAFFEAVYLDERRPSIRVCWERTRDQARAKGWKWCSRDSCKRQLRKGDRISLEKQQKHRDPRGWRSRSNPYIAQDAERFAAGECWVGDHRPMDLMCRITTPRGEQIFRPWITVWQDNRTRKVCGWVMSAAPSSSTILAALRAGIMDPANRGGPAVVLIDNGKDFDCYSFHGRTKKQRRDQGVVRFEQPQIAGVFGLLQIDARFSLPYNPQGKARCERFFATVAGSFDKTFPTYTGKDTNRKPEMLRGILKESREVPTFQHVRDRFADFVAGYNANTEHSIDDLFDEDDGRMLSPAEAYDRWCPTRRMYADPGVLDMCLMQWHKPVSFGREGIKLAIAGQRLTYGRMTPALSKYKGRGKCLHVAYDPNDLGEVCVFDKQMRKVCVAPLDVSGGVHGAVSREHVAELSRQKAEYRRSLAKVRDGFALQYRSTEELLADMAADSADGERAVAAPDAPLKIVRTPIDGLVDAANRSRAKRVAGAECDVMPDRQGLPSLDGLREAVRGAGRQESPAELPFDLSSLRTRRTSYDD